MTDSLSASRGALWLHRYAVFTAASTCVLIFVGGLVTSTGSGLAVPDWPLSFGQVFPPMVGGVFYEHGHRMVATMVGFLTVVLAVWVWLKEPRPLMHRLALAAVLAVVLQGVLGGLTVLLKLPTVVSVAHACLGQGFFCITVALAVLTDPRWESYAGSHLDGETLPRLCLVTTAAVAVQLILGATMRHMGAGLAIPDFPLSFGRLLPPVFPPPILVHFLHRVGAAVVTVLAVLTAVSVLRRYIDRPALRRPARLLVTLVLVQISLGALTIWTWRAVLPTTAHVAVGAAVLAASLVLTLRSYQMVRPAERSAFSRVLPEQVVA